MLLRMTRPVNRLMGEGTGSSGRARRGAVALVFGKSRRRQLADAAEPNDAIESHAQTLTIARIRALHPAAQEAALIGRRGDYERLGRVRDELKAGMGLRPSSLRHQTEIVD